MKFRETYVDWLFSNADIDDLVFVHVHIPCISYGQSITISISKHIITSLDVAFISYIWQIMVEFECVWHQKHLLDKYQRQRVASSLETFTKSHQWLCSHTWGKTKMIENMAAIDKKRQFHHNENGDFHLFELLNILIPPIFLDSDLWRNKKLHMEKMAKAND